MLLSDAIRKYGWLGISNDRPNSHNYFVDTNHVNALDANDGEHGTNWETPFATIAYAITRNNADGNSYDMSNIYVAAGTYTEDLTVLPKNCEVIGIGAKVRIQGNLAIAASAINSRWWNIQFRENDALPIIAIPTSCHGFELHNCRLEDQGACTMALELGNSQDVVIEKCQVGMGSPPPIGINISGTTMKGMRIVNNQIFAVTTGINVAASVASTYQAIIKGNDIEKGDPAGFSSQMDYGIKFMKSNGSQGVFVVDNNISAVDAIYFAYTGSNHYQWLCVRNRIGEGASPAWEDA